MDYSVANKQKRAGFVRFVDEYEDALEFKATGKISPCFCLY